MGCGMDEPPIWARESRSAVPEHTGRRRCGHLAGHGPIHRDRAVSCSEAVPAGVSLAVLFSGNSSYIYPFVTLAGHFGYCQRDSDNGEKAQVGLGRVRECRVGPSALEMLLSDCPGSY